jgi:hypothetical protein
MICRLKTFPLGSTNGTFINRQAVTESGLLPGQLLRLGGVEMVFQAEAAPAIAGVAATPVTALGTELPPIGSVHIQTPPVPPPVSARMRPVNSTPTGTVTLAREAAPPVAEAPPPPPARELIELPEGKSACKFHPRNPAQWLCDKCRHAFCSLCVTTRPTPEGAGYYCRTCGVTCLPVKIKYAVTKEKVVKEYSDVMVLVRSVGFGFGAAVLAATLWAAIGAVSNVMIYVLAPFMIWGTGALAGFAVKIACQDRPGVVFSLIAVGFCLLGIFLGEVGLALTIHRTALSFYGLLGVMFAMFTAWKIGGGDF